jgi:hypothetical protein
MTRRWLHARLAGRHGCYGTAVHCLLFAVRGSPFKRGERRPVSVSVLDLPSRVD